ncbi:MAG: HAD family phosphatase [Desulfobulbaceae bacterium]|nr:HAD family phosphatase [Desulfobulbaceae bacterium]
MGGDILVPPQVMLFDYGGVLAEEGFTAGLKAIGVAHGLEPDLFFHQATEIIYACGYVIGKGTAADFWDLVRQELTIQGSDDELSNEILSRFILRQGMIDKVQAIKLQGIRTAILSDQTNWLDLLDQRDNFLAEFDPVINSYYLGTTKRDPATFSEALRILAVQPEQVLFVDDNRGHIARAAKLGLQTHLFTNEAAFGRELRDLGIMLSTED